MTNVTCSRIQAFIRGDGSNERQVLHGSWVGGVPRVMGEKWITNCRSFYSWREYREHFHFPSLKYKELVMKIEYIQIILYLGSNCGKVCLHVFKTIFQTKKKKVRIKSLLICEQALYTQLWCACICFFRRWWSMVVRENMRKDIRVPGAMLWCNASLY